MKTAIKKLLKKITNNNYDIVFEAREMGINIWLFLIVYDKEKKYFIAGWNKESKFNISDLKYFITLRDAREYILREMN